MVQDVVAQGSTTITVNPRPAITVSASPTTICSGNSSTLLVTGPAGTTYNWDNGHVGSSQSVSPTITTIYTVTATASNSCQTIDQITINVNPSPTYSASLTNPTCGNLNGQIVLTVNNGTLYTVILLIMGLLVKQVERFQDWEQAHITS
ncbi:MAG: hypothetical protein R2779_00690 [Crocinitomicaceae bacterium]